MNKWLPLFLALVILLITAYLRNYELEKVPMHADEATGAYFVSQTLSSNDYQYNPNHFHGPTLIYLAKLSANLSNESSWLNLTSTSLRRVSIIASIFLIVFILFLRKSISLNGSIISAALIASSPFLVYYNKIFIHETLLSLFLIVGLYLLYKSFKKSSSLTAIVTGVFLGLSAATKETFIITFFSWFISYILLDWNHIKQLYKPKFLLYIVISSFITIYLIYSNFGKNSHSFIDFFRSFWLYETTVGHNKPLLYYVNTFILPSNYGRLWWWEGSIFILSLCTILTKRPENKTGYFLFFSGLIQLIIYSALAYKVPWLILVPWIHFIISGSIALSKIITRYNKGAYIIYPLISIVFIFHLKQSYQIVSKFHSDHRNPYAYVPTSKSISRWTEEFSKLVLNENEMSYVIGKDYWPLPWYLKKINHIKYSENIPNGITKSPIIIAMPDQADNLPSSLEETHELTLQGLRNNVSVWVFIRKDIWQKKY